MNLRKARVHLTGQSNKDKLFAQTALDSKGEKPPLHSPSFPYSEQKMRKNRFARSLVPKEIGPIETQQKFYEDQGKKQKTQVKIANPKAAEIEDKRLFGKPFIGGDNEPNVIKASKQDFIQKNQLNDQGQSQQNIQRQKLVETKIEAHKAAVQETQIVLVDHKEGLEGKVDLKRIADIRRTIRRRYANRKDYSKIFNAWDLNNYGEISVKDVQTMMGRLGININENEAKVLVATADLKGSQTLNIDEFFSLIFDDSENLNVNLTTMNPSKEWSNDQGNNKGLYSDLQQMAVNQKLRNQIKSLKEICQQRIQGAIVEFLKHDKKKERVISYDQFKDVMNELEIPRDLNEDKVLKMFFLEMGAKESYLNYQQFIDQIKNYHEDQPQESKERQKLSFYNPLVSQQQEQFENSPPFKKTATQILKNSQAKLNILDGMSVTPNQLEIILQKSRKVRKFLKSKYQNNKKMMEEALVPKSDPRISMQKLREFLSNAMESEQQVSNRPELKDIEGFLSIFKYSVDNHANAKDIVDNVFMQVFLILRDDMQVLNSLNQKKRVHPPMPRQVQSAGQQFDNQKIASLLQTLEDKVFTGTTQQFSVFKQFDVDNDGYVSFKDFQNKLQQLQMNQGDADAIFKHLDQNQNGYLTFKDFSNLIKPQILRSNTLGVSYHINKMQPSQQYLNDQKNTTKNFFNQHQQLSHLYSPQNCQPQYQINRFSYNPPVKNTWDNFIPPKTAGAYLDPNYQYVRKTIDPVNVGVEEKIKFIRKTEAKKNIRIQRESERDQRVQQIEKMTAEKDESKILMKGLRQQDYERRMHLFN